MLHNRGVATQVRQTIVRETLLLIGVLIITFRAMTFVVVDQILASARLTSAVRAIGNVVTVMDTRLTHIVRKTAVRFAFEIIHMLTRWAFLIFALAIWRATVLW
jgi:hypothetical protein